jgi:hypothetical protein
MSKLAQTCFALFGEELRDEMIRFAQLTPLEEALRLIKMSGSEHPVGHVCVPPELLGLEADDKARGINAMAHAVLVALTSGVRPRAGEVLSSAGCPTSLLLMNTDSSSQLGRARLSHTVMGISLSSDLQDSAHEISSGDVSFMELGQIFQRLVQDERVMLGGYEGRLSIKEALNALTASPNPHGDLSTKEMLNISGSNRLSILRDCCELRAHLRSQEGLDSMMGTGSLSSMPIQTMPAHLAVIQLSRSLARSSNVWTAESLALLRQVAPHLTESQLPLIGSVRTPSQAAGNFFDRLADAASNLASTVSDAVNKLPQHLDALGTMAQSALNSRVGVALQAGAVIAVSAFGTPAAGAALAAALRGTQAASRALANIQQDASPQAQTPNDANSPILTAIASQAMQAPQVALITSRLTSLGRSLNDARAAAERLYTAGLRVKAA